MHLKSNNAFVITFGFLLGTKVPHVNTEFSAFNDTSGCLKVEISVY
jgi:hypothetical protein